MCGKERVMNVKLVGYTRQNPALNPAMCTKISDLGTLWKNAPQDGSERTFADALCEYAARVCYRSTSKMGAAPNFMRNRIREGHVDVIEHVSVAITGKGPYTAPHRIQEFNRHCEFTVEMNNNWTLSANLRVWLELFQAGRMMGALPWLKAVAPKVFEEFDCDGGVPRINLGTVTGQSDEILMPREIGQARVTLLGFMSPIVDPYKVHGTATFLVEGVSRSFTHQLVRHRLGSYSQESQRYVDLNKGGWNAIVPPAIMENPEALAAMDFAWETLEDVYTQFRKMGIRKEDARCILPNACETRIIVSMNFRSWQHFFWLRACDKAAQLEIREVGQVMLDMLHRVAPDVFQEHWDVYKEMIAK